MTKEDTSVDLCPSHLHIKLQETKWFNVLGLDCPDSGGDIFVRSTIIVLGVAD